MKTRKTDAENIIRSNPFMSKKQPPRINITRIYDHRRTAAEAFLSVIETAARNPHPSIENLPTKEYTVDRATQAASQEV